MPPRQTKIRALFSLVGIAFALLLGGWWLVQPAYAATAYEVFCPADGNGPEDKLKDAILAVNAMAEFDSILISVTGPKCLFTLVDAYSTYEKGTVGLPRITRNLLIRAVGGRAVIERAINVKEFRLLESTGNLTVENLTFHNGKTKYTGYENPSSGGAIYAHQALTLNNVLFTNNESNRGGAVYAGGSLVMNQVTASHNRTYSAQPSHGGAIAVEGNLTAVNITLTHNIADDCFCGGDIALGGGVYVGGSAVISDAHFYDNRSLHRDGGGLYVAGKLTLSQSNFISNSAFGNGGGIHVTGELMLLSSSFVSNSSGLDGGGVYLTNTATLSDVHFIRNYATYWGGGLSHSQSLFLTSITVEASSFISNQAFYGGGAGIQRGIVRNSLFEDNKARALTLAGGGALVAYTQATIENNRFARNTAFVGGAVLILFYPPEASSDVSRIVNNLWVDNAARDGAAISLGLDLPGFQGDHAQIFHNTIVRQASNNDSAIHVIKSTADVNNNIITKHRVALIANNAAVIADANLLHANTINYLGINGGPNDLTGDPLFVNPTNHDYHLQDGSPAQDNGQVLDVAADIDGVSRPQGEGFDRGAFEIPYVNLAPIGQSDAYTTPLNTALVIAAPGVLGNDSDPEGDALTAAVATAPAHGVVALQAAGTFTYTPGAGFIGTDSFTYQVGDGINSSTAVAVTINVVGDPPSDPADPTDPSPPVAITGLSVFNDGPAAVGQAVKFAAIVETGSNIRYAWNFGDGATGEGATASHVYAGPGEYSVTMTASNSLGDVQATTKVTVQSSDPSDPSDPTDPSGPDIQIQLFTPFIVK